MTTGELIRSTRKRHGLSQARLARRVGTRQSAISRLESDEVSPATDTLRLILRAMGEDLVLDTRPLEHRHDPLHQSDWMSRSPEERLRLGSSWNRMAGRIARAGKSAKAGSAASTDGSSHGHG